MLSTTSGALLAAVAITHSTPIVQPWLSEFGDVAGPLLRFVALPGAVLAAIYAAWMLAKKTWLGSASLLPLYAMVVMAFAMWLTRELALVWPWLGAIPLALTMGSVASAATTLVVPFRDASAMPPK